MVYGAGIRKSSGTATVAAEPEKAPGGNIILRIGETHPLGTGWSQQEHLVLEPGEAAEYARKILALAEEGS